MRKITLFLILILLILTPVFAYKELDFVSTNHLITGYINSVLKLEVSNYYYEDFNNGKGISLNLDDTSNEHRFLLTPTQVPKSVPGLLIGDFSITSSSPEYRLTVLHDELINDNNSNIRYDYELCIYYSVNVDSSIVKRQVYCTSGEYAIINFNEVQGTLMLRNAGLYLRLCTEVPEVGTYTSFVTLTLESLQ